jgi:hypothetical protein
MSITTKCLHVNHWLFPCFSHEIAIHPVVSTQAELWKSTASCRLWIRWTLSTMGRGGSAGQQIRDEILVIMHAHNIKDRERKTAKMTYQKKLYV